MYEMIVMAIEHPPWSSKIFLASHFLITEGPTGIDMILQYSTGLYGFMDAFPLKKRSRSILQRGSYLKWIE